MSTSSDLSSVWVTSVFNHTAIKAYSPKYYAFAVTEDSEYEVDKLTYQQEINFWQILIARAHIKEVTNMVTYQFSVEVGYYRAKTNDTSGVAWTAVRDALETLYDTVDDELGATWGNTVDYWRPQEEPGEITEIALAGDKVWQGIYRFTGIQQISL